jgi:hypothetical protein
MVEFEMDAGNYLMEASSWDYMVESEDMKNMVRGKQQGQL